MKTRVIIFLLLAAPALARGGDALSALGDLSLAAPAPEAGAPLLTAGYGGRELGGVDAAPIDDNADAAARALYARLLAQYGKKTVAGQTSKNFGEVAGIAGLRPLLKGFDMQNYSPHNPWRDDWAPWDDGSVQEAIDWHNSTGGRGIVSFQWHWFSPSGGKPRTSTFFSNKTSFDVSRAVTEGTEEHRLVLRDIDAVAVQLKRLRDAGVPVLWRPLHEAGGRWFWWGTGGAENCKKLYYLMYNRLVYHHGLHNLLWVWSTPEKAWYPGSVKVDIFGYDSYPGAHEHHPQRDMFAKMHAVSGGKKMLALSEAGPIPDIDLCFRLGAPWAYFMTWAELTAQQNWQHIIYQAYRNPRVLTLD